MKYTTRSSLNILNEYVSKFIICETNYSHKDIKKRFNIKNFTSLKIKVYVPLQTLLKFKKIEDKIM